MSKETAPFYGTEVWKQTRKAYKKAAGGLCEICLKQGLCTAGEFVHHRIPLTATNMNDPEIALSFDNLMLVCRKHHEQIHDKRKRRYKLDDMGRVIFMTDEV